MGAEFTKGEICGMVSRRATDADGAMIDPVTVSRSRLRGAVVGDVTEINQAHGCLYCMGLWRATDPEQHRLVDGHPCPCEVPGA